MKRTRIKICGMSKPDQVAAAVAMGVDAVGMIFYEKSPRCVTLEQAKEIRRVVPAFVSLVGVFVNETTAVINDLSKTVGLDLIQLHGDETAGDAEQLTRPYLRAIRVKNPDYVSLQIAEHKNARAYLLDSYSDALYGGTGKMFDKESLPEKMPENLIYAGGISPLTIDRFLLLNPFAIDVSSGIESSPGDKDVNTLKGLVKLVREHDVK